MNPTGSKYNSPAMQEMLQPGDYGSQDCKYLPYDVICPQAVTLSNAGENNAHADHCEIRLLSGEIPFKCRRCEVGQKVAQERGFELKHIIQTNKCKCGADRVKGSIRCQPCKELHAIEFKERERQKAIKKREQNRKKCRCGNRLEKFKSYCHVCKAEIKQIKRMKGKAKSPALKAHCERRLKELTNAKEK